MAIDHERLRQVAGKVPIGPWQWVDGANDRVIDDFSDEFVDTQCEGRPDLRTVWTRTSGRFRPLPLWIISNVEELQGEIAEYLVAVSPDVILELLDELEHEIWLREQAEE